MIDINEFRIANQQQLDQDRAELEDLEAMLMRLPEEILVAYARMTRTRDTAEFRLRAAAAFAAMQEMIAVVGTQQPGPTRAKIAEPLQRWRVARDKIMARLRPRTAG